MKVGRITFNSQQPSLLDGMTPMFRPRETPIDKRMRAMSSAEKAADEIWRRDYPLFVLRWLEANARGTAEDIRLAWERQGRVSPGGSKRASGAIFRKLSMSGEIREVGREKSGLYGNKLAVYERVR
jgi:hypothetical protein